MNENAIPPRPNPMMNENAIPPRPNRMMSENTSVKSKAGFVIGIIAIIIMVVALFPCIGAINWLNIPFGIVGLILNIMAISESSSGGTPTGRNVAGAIMCGIAIAFGGLRLIIGGGIL